MDGFNFYRIKTEWTSEQEGGALKKTKTEELVYASSYTEAEKVAYDLIERCERTRFGDANFEIIKTKISELLWDNILVLDTNPIDGLVMDFFEESDSTGVGMYQVRVLFTEIDEKTAKEKRSTENIFIPARSNSEAANAVLSYLKKTGDNRDYVVRDTRFDKAEAILWPADVRANKINRMY